MNRNRIRLAVVALGVCWTAAALAQAGGPALKLNQVTEQGLVDALAIDEPAAESGARTRSIRPTARSNNPSTSSNSTAAGRSNLLITFLTNSAELTKESKDALGTVAKAMQSEKLSGLSFSIEGHADPRGSAELNQKLSESRAKAVADYLVSKGVDGARLSSAGFGESRPIAANETDAGRAQNRRVTLKFSAR
jgi:outer membrane protein OmpA-like peptidoglycan-associated protein